jgi:hypothetical protein
VDNTDELTHADKVMYTTGLPLLLLVGGLFLFSLLRSHGGPAEPVAAKQSPAAVAAAQRREEQAAARRELFRDCMKANGAVTTGAGRFRRAPSRDKLRDASALCATIVDIAETPAPSKPRQPGLPIA